MKKNLYLFRPAGAMCITIIATMLLCGCRSEKKTDEDSSDDKASSRRSTEKAELRAAPTETAEEVAAQEELIIQEELIMPEEIVEVEVATRAQDPSERGVEDIIDRRQHYEEVVVEQKTKTSNDDNKIFTTVEQDPEFPGGQAALMKHIADHIIYPTVAMENGIQGRVVLQFVVTKTGEIGQVKVVRSKDPDLDREAVRVVNTLPKFIPGKMNGKPVNVWFTLPVTFRLNN